MRHLRRGTSGRAQQGFSMVEMLLTAFILAIGIMGLTMLQVMALRGASGGRNLATAVQVGELVMDQIEMEGRLTWLNITATQYNPPKAINTTYINHLPLKDLPTFTIKGQVPITTATDPVDSKTFYTVTIAEANVRNAGSGKMGDFTIDVVFHDQADANNAQIDRHVVITRSILHG